MQFRGRKTVKKFEILFNRRGFFTGTKPTQEKPPPAVEPAEMMGCR
jgi:hypothetical protein